MMIASTRGRACIIPWIKLLMFMDWKVKKNSFASIYPVAKTSSCAWCLGEWKSRFDARFTAKDLFYIDRQTSVKVDMMMGSKYPLSMFVDGEQGIQVVWLYSTNAEHWDYFPSL